MDEIWKDIPGYEGYYQASSFGRVRSIARISIRNNGKSEHAVYHTKERLKEIQKQTQGYSQVVLYKDGTPKTIRLNTLIARMFVQNPGNKPFVNHIDGNKDNNRADNLEWVTATENITHAYRTGLLVHYTKAVLQIDDSGIVVKEYGSIKEAAESFRGSKGNICMACRGNGRNRAYGYYWKYKNE